MSTIAGVDGLEITGPIGDRYDEVLTPRALELVALLHRELNGRRLERLAARREQVQALADGGTLDFLPETAHIREDSSWRVADPAPGRVDRRVEMTGPTDRKMTINALNSGARCSLADQEDANSPLWGNVVNGPLAEISRSQVWQWLHNGVRLSNGETVTRELVERITDEEMKAITESRGDALASGRWDDARALFLEMAVADDYSDFLTLPAYERMP